MSNTNPITVEQVRAYLDGTGPLPGNPTGVYPHIKDGGNGYLSVYTAPASVWCNITSAETAAEYYNAALPAPEAAVEPTPAPLEIGELYYIGYGFVGEVFPLEQDERAVAYVKAGTKMVEQAGAAGELYDVEVADDSFARYVAASVNACRAANLTVEQLEAGAVQDYKHALTQAECVITTLIGEKCLNQKPGAALLKVRNSIREALNNFTKVGGK